MLRYRIADILAERGWTAYRLAKETGINLTTAYRLAREGARVDRIEGKTLEDLCRALKVQPGDLLEYVPDARSRRR